MSGAGECQFTLNANLSGKICLHNVSRAKKVAQTGVCLNGLLLGLPVVSVVNTSSLIRLEMRKANCSLKYSSLLYQNYKSHRDHDPRGDNLYLTESYECKIFHVI